MSSHGAPRIPNLTKLEADPNQKQSDTTATLQIVSSTELSKVTAAIQGGTLELPVKSNLSSTERFMEAAPRLETPRHGKLRQDHVRQGSEDSLYDQKYGENGYFGFENIGTPEGTEPGKLSEREKLEIINTETQHDPEASLGESNNDQGRLICYTIRFSSFFII